MDKFKRLFIILLGSILTGAGIFFFYMPLNLTVGGLSGFAIGLNHFFPQFSVGMIMLILDLFLFVLGFILLGTSFGFYTVLSSLMISGSLIVLEKIFPNQGPLTEDILLNLFVGILTVGGGVAIVINQEASTGGTDIIAMILRKYLNVSIGAGLFIADIVTIFLGGSAYGMDIFLYGLIGVLANSIVVERMIQGFNIKVNMFIISNKVDQINDYIIHDLDRGTTIYKAEGGYTREERQIINTIVSQRQYITIRHQVEEIDPSAFISISYVREVLGEGFTYELEGEKI